ncbi:ferric reductase-like transmembrane domain-containing protein [Nocardioides sp.]|uniref:ferric reductase-like transmembrane domain-containing protein n=1 Tax=Nocardioides sp. TaxID=35761 RepID=UPI0035112504
MSGLTPLSAEAMWALGRGTGVAALVLFTVAVVLGIGTRAGATLPGLGRVGASDLHRTASLTATGLVVLHLTTLTLDPYAQLTLLDWLVPFFGEYRPLWQGLGTVAVDLLVVIVAVSLLRHRVGPRVFRGVHLLTYLLWPVALAHGLGNGTDAGHAWFVALAVACTAAVVLALLWRLSPAVDQRGRQRVPRKVLA